jgi:two-component system KDP operon response regulator KdpE
MSEPQILIVDDEPQIRKLLKITLQSNGYGTSEAASAKEAIRIASNHPPDLILLDLGLPDESGHVVLKNLREWYTKPIIILSIQSSEEDIVKALDNGADDYLVKPFRTGELMARIRSVLRKTDAESDNFLMAYGDFIFDLISRTVKHKGEFIKLTSTEYNLIVLLAKNEGKVLTHQHILRNIWGIEYTKETQYLRVFIAGLRKKIEENPNQPRFIITESGVGYRFVGKE